MDYSIGDVSKMTNLPISTIRYYDKEGLLPFLKRKKSGRRIFTQADIQMLQIIECFKSTGMPIKDIRQFVELVKEGDASLQKRYDLFLKRRKAAQQQMEELQKQLKIIDYKCWYYETAIEAGTEDVHHQHNNSDTP